VAPVERPLALGELLAETVRFYGERFWAALGIGAALVLAIALAIRAPAVADLAVVALALTGCYAASARVVSGDAFREAWAQVLVRLPVLVVLTAVVSVPLVLALTDWLVLFFAAAWLAIAGFSIPVAMVEQHDANVLHRLGYALRRSLTLARTEFLHAFGVAAALTIIYVFFGRLLAAALGGFADNPGAAAFLLVQLVLAPFFFIGLSVLYFEQRARAVSSRRTDDRRK